MLVLFSITRDIKVISNPIIIIIEGTYRVGY